MDVLTSLASAAFGRHARKTLPISVSLLSAKDEVLETMALQYWPESIQDPRGSTWTNKTIPGGSLPVYQWVNGNERPFTWALMLTTDLNLARSRGGGYESGAVDRVLVDRLRQNALQRQNIDIRSAILWLRQFTTPTYADGITRPPPKALIDVPNMALGLGAGDAGVGEDFLVGVVTQCDAEYVSTFPNGMPRIARVTFGFAQTPQYRGKIQFPGTSGAFKQSRYAYAPYALPGRTPGLGLKR